MAAVTNVVYSFCTIVLSNIMSLGCIEGYLVVATNDEIWIGKLEAHFKVFLYSDYISM